MKDVASCDKPRGAAQQAVIRGFPNGATWPESCPVTEPKGSGRTRGTETSQYPEEEKSNEIPSVAASERGGAQTGHSLECSGLWGPRQGMRKGSGRIWKGPP